MTALQRPRSPLLTALLNPFVLAMLGLSVLAGLCAAWWLFPIGVLLAAFMAFRITRDPSVRMAQTLENRVPLSPRFQQQFDRIERTQVGIFNALATAPPDVASALQPIQPEVNTLIDHVHRLGERMTTLENYRVVSNASGDPTAELARLDQQIAAANDPLVKKEYQDSRAAVQKRIDNLTNVNTFLDRIDAQFTSLSNELDGLLAEMIRLQAQGATAAAKQVPTLVQTLRDQTSQLAQFEQEAARF